MNPSRTMPALVLSALAGATALSLVVVFVRSPGWIGEIFESEGGLHIMVWVLRLYFETLFLTPWGLMGAWLGLGVGWLTLSARKGP